MPDRVIDRTVSPDGRPAALRPEWIAVLTALTDVGAVLGAGIACGVVFSGQWSGSASAVDYAGLGAVDGVLFVLLARAQGGYELPKLLQARWQIRVAVRAWLATLAITMAVAFFLKAGGGISRSGAMGFGALGLGLLLPHRLWIARTIQRAIREGRFASRRVALITDGAAGDLGHRQAFAQRQGMRIVTHVYVDFDGMDNLDEVAASLTTSVRGADIDEVLIAFVPDHFEAARRVIDALRIVPIPIRLLLDPNLSDLVRRPKLAFGPRVAVEMQREPLTLAERAVKRTLDITIAASALFVAAPVLVLAAIAIRIDSAGPVLFRQTRHGFNDRPFRILKLRTMRVMEDGPVIRQARRNDERVTRVGRFLRRTSIDELPQLLNVLRGDMSIVGPRPHAVAHDNYYEALIADYAFRHHMKPGLTGWAQVNGSRGETPTVDSMAERVRYDIWYVDNWSIWLDLRIILKTAFLLFETRKAY